MDHGRNLADAIKLHLARYQSVSEEVEPDLFGSRVSDITMVRLVTLSAVAFIGDYADRKSQSLVDGLHQFSITLGKVIVSSRQMRPFATERVEIDWQRGGECFAFTGLHDGDAAMKNGDATQQLHVIVLH